MEKQKIVGVDFSLNSPGVCIHIGDVWDWKNCSLMFLTGNPKNALQYNIQGMKISGLEFKEYQSDHERFIQNASMVRDFIMPDHQTQILFEGYAFGATGSRIFQIGEATGFAKMLCCFGKDGLINHGLNVNTVPPMTVKKFATGKGNAKKEDMFESFSKETGIDLLSEMKMKKLGSPVHDIVDAYWICKYAFHLNTKSIGEENGKKEKESY